MNEERKTPVWVWIGLGCLIPVVLVAVLIGAAGFWGYKTVKQVTSATPEERAERAMKILGCEKIPEGYYPAFSITVPFLAEFTMLGDKAPEFKGGKGDAVKERGFFYVNSIKGNDDGKNLKDYVEGKAEANEITSQGGLQVGHDLELIRRGQFPFGPGTLRYAANRGSVTAEGKHVKGLVTIFFVECPADTRVRMGAWFGPDPRPGEPAASADFSGSQADEKEIQAFLSHFSLCPK